MAGELKLNQVSTPTTPASGKDSVYVGTDKIPHYLDEAGGAAVLSPTYFVRLTAAYTLTSTTNSQKAFNLPSAGALTLPSNTAYFFECLLHLTTMSATSGNMGFDILGAGGATISNQLWSVNGLDATTQTTGAATGGSSAAAANTGDIVTAGTGTGLVVLIKGTFSITTGGTIIPSVKLTTAATPTVDVGSYFRVHRIGLDTVTTVGPWT